MNTNQKSFIEELRSLSDPVKHKIFFGAAAASMVVIIYFWLAYFNTIVPGSASDAATQTAQGSADRGVLGLFADAASSFWQAMGSSVQGIAREMKNPRQYNISRK